MAYREHGMWEVLEVLRRVHAGEALRSVARGTGRSPKTVRRYVRLARKLGWQPKATEPPDEQLASRVAVRLRPGPHELSETLAEAALLTRTEELRRWLAVDCPEKRGLTLTKVRSNCLGVRVRAAERPVSGAHDLLQRHLHPLNAEAQPRRSSIRGSTLCSRTDRWRGTSSAASCNGGARPLSAVKPDAPYRRVAIRRACRRSRRTPWGSL
jgi:hypothetical protein